MELPFLRYNHAINRQAPQKAGVGNFLNYELTDLFNHSQLRYLFSTQLG
jgi:hypothetical protein